MAEGEGRPNFDLSSFSTFTFPVIGQAAALPDETTHVAEASCKVSQAQEEIVSAPRTQPPTVSQDEQLIDLVKYGPPGALAKLNQTVPATVMAVLESSIDNVRSQVDTELQIRNRQDSAIRQSSQDMQQQPAKNETPESIDKGEAIATAHFVPTLGPASSVAPDQTDTASFYTPSEGIQIPSADAQSETGMDAPAAEDSAPDLTPMPRLKASSISTIPRRRDLIKAMLQGMSDNDARQHVLRRSKGAFQFKAKLRHAKRIWQGELQIGFVLVTVPSPRSYAALLNGSGFVTRNCNFSFQTNLVSQGMYFVFRRFYSQGPRSAAVPQLLPGMLPSPHYTCDRGRIQLAATMLSPPHRAPKMPETYLWKPRKAVSSEKTRVHDAN